MAATPVASAAHESGVASWGTFAGDVPQTCRTLHPPPEAGGVCRESSPMRLAQLPTACPARTKVLPRPCSRIQPAARQLNSKRIRCGAPPPPQAVGGTPSRRRNTHLRQMRTTSHSHRPMGPRPHRQQTKLDRARASQLQQARRPTQSNRRRRTLDTTPSHSSNRNRSQQANRKRKHKHDANEPNTSGQAKQAHATKTTKHTPNRKKYNQPTRQHH